MFRKQQQQKKRSEVVCTASSISGLNRHAHVTEDSCWYRCVQAPQAAARALTCCLWRSAVTLAWSSTGCHFTSRPCTHALWLPEDGSLPGVVKQTELRSPFQAPSCQLKAVCRAGGFGGWVLRRGRLIKGPVLSYRKPNGPAGRRKCGWSARLQPVWPSLRWGMWSMPCHCTVHWSCTKWEQHLAGAAGRQNQTVSVLPQLYWENTRGSPQASEWRSLEGSSLTSSSQVKIF